jgi:hypothetical protein
MSECFRHNMEAFKLPIDKGFDLVVTRASQHIGISAPADAPAVDRPILLQVKSVQITDPPRQEKDRVVWPFSFSIKAEDVDLICNVPNSALVCVVFMLDTNDYSSGRTAYAWWIPSAAVAAMKSKGYFLTNPKNPEKLQLMGELRKNKQLYVTMLRASKTSAGTATGYTVKASQFDFAKLCAEALHALP